MCKPAWWPAGVPLTDINKSKQRPKKDELILIMKSFRNWNLQDQSEECEMIANSHDQDTEIPIPAASTLTASSSPKFFPWNCI